MFDHNVIWPYVDPDKVLDKKICDIVHKSIDWHDNEAWPIPGPKWNEIKI